jgi:acetolactate synthase-1/2/3 large subunit
MSLTRVSDYIARFLADQGVDLVFAITGSGNIRLIEAAHQAGIRYVCPHHEQAAVMAALTRTRVSGKPAVCLVTGGPGAANTLIAVADAHLDSIPCIIIAGQEKLQFVEPPNAMRGKGVQGLDMVNIMSSVTKFSTCLTYATDIRSVLEHAFHEARSGRPGPVWIDVPQDLQWAHVDPDSLVGYAPPVASAHCDMQQAATATLQLIQSAQRPLLWVGHGIRLSQCEKAFRRVFDALGVPALVSWQAADLVPDTHPLYVGRAGTYGQRWANLALQNCDLLITLGTRLALPQRGYVDAEFARAAKKVIVEIDPVELAKFTFPIDVPVLGDVKDFIAALDQHLPSTASVTTPLFQFDAWSQICSDWRQRYPMSHPPEPKAFNAQAGINSYWFIERLSEFLGPDDIVVTDMGASLTCTHASIRIKDGQRLVTSTGLGEMGFGLPGAIGVALGAPDRRVVLVAGEGSLMMNLQELQTLRHLQLPIKIFLFNNNGYLTIKHTHNALFGSNGNASATGPQTGVSFPDFSKIAPIFGMEFRHIADPEGLDDWIQSVLSVPGSVLAEVTMPEFQELVPKSALKLRSDGSLYSPPLEDLYPFLPHEQLAREMLIPMLNEQAPL